MKKITSILILLLFALMLNASVLDLFYPTQSYASAIQIKIKPILGKLDFNEVPKKSNQTMLLSSLLSYIFYNEKNKTGYFVGPSDSIYSFDDASAINYDSQTGNILSEISFGGEKIYNENGEILNTYTIEEETDKKIVLSKDNVRVEYEDFDTWARKILYLDDSVYSCHWIYGWSYVDGVKIPSEECFYFMDFFFQKCLLFKETKNTSIIGKDFIF